jgi:carboxylesterase type B
VFANAARYCHRRWPEATALAKRAQTLFGRAMTKSPPSPSEDKAARAERLAAALRENLKRRKAQARARRTAEPSPATKSGEPEQA